MSDVDVVVIGSGFGGSVAALRLTEKGYRVAVLEAGRRFGADDFAKTNWNLRRYLFMPKLGLRGIQRLSMLNDLVVISGAGVGGGSLVYANTLYEPLAPFFDDPQWAAIADWRAELAPHYARARRMLGVVETPFETPAEDVVREVATRMGVGDTFHRTPVGVYFGDEDGVDPYFGGAGPPRSPCIRCGGCMVGCRHNAKNTLDRNYLWLAERGGATVHAEREATLLRRAGDGWEIETERSGAWVRKRPELFRAEHVVLAAGVLGTLRLLFRSGLGGANVGTLVRSNSEVIVGAGARDASVDYSTGIAIGSSFHPSAETHIEPVRYPKGSSMMGLFSTILVDGGGSTPRPLRWLGAAVRHPGTFLRAHRVRRWAERTVILLVMQARDNSLRVTWTGRRLRSGPGHGEPAPSWIPEANEAARLAAGCDGRRARLRAERGAAEPSLHRAHPRRRRDRRDAGRRRARRVASRVERAGTPRRRRRRGLREPRREPVADDRRAGGAGTRVLAEPRRAGSAAAAGRALFAGRAGSRRRACCPVLGDRALQRLLRENAGAVAADDALDPVRDTVALDEQLHAHSAMLVQQMDSTPQFEHQLSHM